MKRIMVILTALVVSFGMVGYVYATDWKITGYLPQKVQADKSYKAVTIKGSFSAKREGRRVKIGNSNKVFDLTSNVIAWTSGEVQVKLPTDISPGKYWLAIYAPNDQLLVKGPETFTVYRKIRVVKPIYMCPQGWKLKPGSVDYKRGSFECVPVKPKLNCPDGTTYFETDCSIGCQPVPW